MYLYVATADAFLLDGVVKLGLSQNPYGRQATYLTGCPPGFTPSQRVEIVALWETNATTKSELENQEDMLHNQFIKNRLQWMRPGDSEWFKFDSDPLASVNNFLKSQNWIKESISVDSIRPKAHQSQKGFNKNYGKNTYFVNDVIKRNAILDSVQLPIIQSIEQFMMDDNDAGFVIAPCGSGKTVMTVKGIKIAQRVIICCPSNHIQQQWKSSIIQHSDNFVRSNTLLLGTTGTTDVDTITEFMRNDVYCVITSYQSSALLVDLIQRNVDVIVFDEAHHLAGVISQETGEGKTRKLMAKASQLKVKRLSLTFTPRFVYDVDGGDTEYLTMDDASIFGSEIANIRLRDMIKNGTLPDYRLWMMRDDSNKGCGILGKADCIINAWNSTEIVRGGKEKHILHHLIIFTRDNYDAVEMETYLKNNLGNTLVIRVQGGDNLEGPLKAYNRAERAIIINCKVLGEGVDIPIINSVAITYTKHARGEITQMLLRAGRWHPNKPMFHMILPALDEDDMSGFEDVLTTLASFDDKIRDEVMVRYTNAVDENKDNYHNGDATYVVPETIMIDDCDGGDQEKIKQVFGNTRRNVFTVKEHKRIQRMCVDRGIRTSVEYGLLRAKCPELLEIPTRKNEMWFDFLNPNVNEKIDPCVLVRDTLEKYGLQSAAKYNEWHTNNHRQDLPSLQNILDGYYGADMTEFNTMVTKYRRMLTLRTRR